MLRRQIGRGAFGKERHAVGVTTLVTPDERVRLACLGGEHMKGITLNIKMVEARGVEPLSEDRQRTGSTCVADSLSFAATHAHRLA